MSPPPKKVYKPLPRYTGQMGVSSYKRNEINFYISAFIYQAS